MGTFALCATGSRRTGILQASSAEDHASRYITLPALGLTSRLTVSRKKRHRQKETTNRLSPMRIRHRKGRWLSPAMCVHNSLHAATFASKRVPFRNSSSSSVNEGVLDSWKPITRARKTRKCLMKRILKAVMLKPQEHRRTPTRIKLRNVSWALATNSTTLNASKQILT